ncbi:MliC family protein [Desulfovibrio aminophilus]|nr:MliC family protein [Desulfovibrio aminophilus]MCM0755703.1 MliC family protein [Desulfovibrio aminophilus]
MRILSATCLLLALAVPALAGSQAPGHGPVYGPYAYTCEDGSSFSAVFDNAAGPDGVVILTFPDGVTLTLPRAVSGSGIRYTDGKHEFWGKGDQASWAIGRRAPVSCSTRD